MANDQDQASEQGDAKLPVLHLDVGGMHCVNCGELIEQRLAQLPQVRRVSVDRPSARATITHTGSLDLVDLQKAIADDGYTLSIANDDSPRASQGGANTPRDYLEIAAAFAVLAGLVLALQHVTLLPRGFSVSDTVSFGLAFGIGLVASVSSCIAVTGGLLVAFAAKYDAANAHLARLDRLQPHLYFNAGRLISYALLGGTVGALGSALMLSPATSGLLTLLASAIMIVFGLQMLGLFSSLGRLMPTMPKLLGQRIQRLAGHGTRQTAFLLGGLTFFLPCGFTQALQLYVLAKGDFLTGALTMLAFALGTLPALLSLSAMSSLTSGALQRRLLKFAGAAVILLGIGNIRSGLVLNSVGNPPATVASRAPVKSQQAGGIGSQRISMKVVGLDYQPNQFTVKQGVPVEWWIDASEAEGCGRVLIAPQLHIQKILSDQSTTLIRFSPDRTGDYAFNCGMGMMTPDSKITVLPADDG
ncbi:MAG: sulfite exporter TauE/SafE family protein [Hyphomicrobiaceae bacterium]